MTVERTYITLAEAAARLGVTVRTIRRYRKQGILTPYERLGRAMVDAAEVARLDQVQPIAGGSSPDASDDDG